MHGYAKNLAVRLSSPQSGQTYLLNVFRFRSRGTLDIGARLHAEAWLDSEVLVGSYLGSPEYVLAREVSRPAPVSLGWTLTSGTEVEARQRLFRAFVTWHTDWGAFTAGRQRIAWGSGFAWNPTDVLNPFNPGAIELGERAGVDAAHLNINLGPLSRLELVAAHTHVGRPGSYAARWGANVQTYDVSLMAGRFGRSWSMGGDFAGYLRGAGVRGEAAYTHREGAPGYSRAVVNADYTFSAGVYGLVELYFNGRGQAHKSRYDFQDLLTGETFNLARWYAAASASAAVTPLLGAGLYQLANLVDGSLLVGPSLTYSLAQSLEIAAAAYFFVGPLDTEFGRQRHLYFGALQWYF